MNELLNLIKENYFWSFAIFLWIGIAIAVIVTDYRDKTLGWRTIAKVLFIPFMLAYEFTFALFVMPFLYGKKIGGAIGFILAWLLYFVLIFFSWIPSIGDNMHKINRLANYFMGYMNGQTVSSTLGDRIDDGKASWVSCLHCRILAVYDRRGYHCSERAKRLF